MRKIILFVVFFFVSFTVSPQNSNKDTLRNNKVDHKIDSIMQENKKDLELIKTVSEENKKRMQTIQQIDEKQNLLLDKILLKKTKQPKQVVKTNSKIITRKVPETIYVVNKLDSSCIKFKKKFLGAKKCIEWDYKK